MAFKRETVENRMVVDSEWDEPDEMHFYCCECGNEIEDDIYEDEHNEFLCADCLKLLHKKEI